MKLYEYIHYLFLRVDKRLARATISKMSFVPLEIHRISESIETWKILEVILPYYYDISVIFYQTTKLWIFYHGLFLNILKTRLYKNLHCPFRVPENIFVILFKFIITDSPLLKKHRLIINLKIFENLSAFFRLLFLSEEAISFQENT